MTTATKEYKEEYPLQIDDVDVDVLVVVVVGASEGMVNVSWMSQKLERFCAKTASRLQHLMQI